MNFVKLQAKLQSKVDWIMFAEYTPCLVNGPDEIRVIDSASKKTE